MDDPFRDYQLQVFASMVARGYIEGMSLSLSVPGGVVTGMLISEARYLDLLVEGASDEGTTKILGSIRTGLQREGEPPSDASGYAFLHLRDVAFLTGQGVSASSGISLWRVRIDQVAGWSFQRMS